MDRIDGMMEIVTEGAKGVGRLHPHPLSAQVSAINRQVSGVRRRG